MRPYYGGGAPVPYPTYEEGHKYQRKNSKGGGGNGNNNNGGNNYKGKRNSYNGGRGNGGGGGRGYNHSLEGSYNRQSEDESPTNQDGSEIMSGGGEETETVAAAAEATAETSNLQ
jgi:hypothetical protein